MKIIQNIFKKKGTSSNVSITIDKNIKLSPGESLSPSSPIKKRTKSTLDEQWRRISEQSHKNLQEGALGLYACDLYSLSEINRKENAYEQQLHLLTLSAYIHLSGIDTLESYSYWKDGDFSIVQPRPLLPPAVVRSMDTCITRLNMSIEQYREFYSSIVTATLTPSHVFGIEKSLEIICTYLNGNSEKADRMVVNGTKKFIRKLSSKGR